VIAGYGVGGLASTRVDGANASPMTVGGGQQGRYELLGRLAVGGMAELFLARPMDAAPRDGPPVVVLKRILPHLAEDPEFVRMFHDEAVLAGKLEHPNIVRVRDIGLDGETHFFTMEYVHGENLRLLLKAAQERGDHIPLSHVLTIALGVTSALHHAHEQVDEHGDHLRIVHRDVSPTNVLVARDGGVKLVDFGIAKAAAATHVTQAGMLKGKASYMSPEQCRADPVDRRSDVFSMGILLFEMSTLTRLFRGDNELVILNQVLTGAVTPPSQRRDDYPPELERIVLRALQTKPDARYQTALEMHGDLVRFAEDHGIEPSAHALAGYVHDLFGPKPLPWSRPSVRFAQHASESGIATQVDPIEGDETQTTAQRDKTPARAPPRAPPRGRARKPTGKQRASTGRNDAAPAALDRSPATPGRRSAWTGRRPNADPGTRPPGAPRPATGPTSHARVEAVPAPRLQAKSGRAPVRAKARIDPAPRPGRPRANDRATSTEPRGAPAAREKPPSRVPSGPHPAPSRPAQRGPSGPHPASPKPGPHPRVDPAKESPAAPRAAPPDPASPSRPERQTGPRRAAPRPRPPGVRSPSFVDRTQLGPRPPAASAPKPAAFTPPFVPETAAAGDRTQFAPASSGVSVTMPPGDSASATFDAVDRTMVASDDDFAKLRGAAFPAEGAALLTGHTQPMRPSELDIQEALRAARGPRVGLVVALVLVPIILAVVAWAVWSYDVEPNDESAATADVDDVPEAADEPKPDVEENAIDPSTAASEPIDPEPAANEAESGANETEPSPHEEPDASSDDAESDAEPSAEDEPAVTRSSPQSVEPRARSPRKTAPPTTPDEVPALPGFGPGHVPP
jgi:serine/threonine protein kinase